MGLEQQKDPIRYAVETLAGSPLGAWFILNIARPIDEALLKISQGRISTIQLAVPTLLLTTIGAKSGQPRSVPLVFLRDGQRIVLMASNGGQPKHPAWYHNLKANPVVTVTYAGQSGTYRAYEAEGEEYARLWQQAVRLYKGYHDYKTRADAHRTIPVIVLTPEEPA